MRIATFAIAVPSKTTHVRQMYCNFATCQTGGEASETKMEGASKIIIPLLLLLLLLPFFVSFDKVTHFKRPMILMSEGYSIAKRNNDDLKEEVSDETCFSPPLSDHPIPSLAAVASLAPSSPPNSSCQRPPLPLSPSCKDSAFTGKLLPRKRRIVHMILFSFEVIPVPL